jgi:hypothetical protein
MIRGLGYWRGAVRCLVGATAAMLVLSAVPAERAEAMSLINAGGVPSAKQAYKGLTVEVHGGGGHGGGVSHGVSAHSSAAPVSAPAFRAAVVTSGARSGHHHHHHFGSFFYGPSYYYYPDPDGCRIIWTAYGERRLCRAQYLYYWRHHHRHRLHPSY